MKRSIELAPLAFVKMISFATSALLFVACGTAENNSVIQSTKSSSKLLLSCSDRKENVNFKVFGTADGVSTRAVLSGRYKKNLECQASRDPRVKWSCEETSNSSSEEDRDIVVNVLYSETAFERKPGFVATVLQVGSFPTPSTVLENLGCSVSKL